MRRATSRIAAVRQTIHRAEDSEELPSTDEDQEFLQAWPTAKEGGGDVEPEDAASVPIKSRNADCSCTADTPTSTAPLNADSTADVAAVTTDDETVHAVSQRCIKVPAVVKGIQMPLTVLIDCGA